MCVVHMVSIGRGNRFIVLAEDKFQETGDYEVHGSNLNTDVRTTNDNNMRCDVS